jgi:hypothetical protein
VEPRRPLGVVRARRQPLRGGRRRRGRARADVGRRPRRAERQAGLGVPGGAVRAREVPGPLVEPRLARDRLPAPGREGRPALHARGRRGDPDPGRDGPLPPGRRAEPGGPAGRRARRGRAGGLDGRPPLSRGHPDRGRGVAGGRRAGPLPGPGPRADVAGAPGRGPRRRPGANAPARAGQGLGGARRGRAVAEGRLVPLAERAHGWQHLYRYKADGTLVGALTSGPGRSGPSTAWTRRAAGSTTRAPSAATSAATSSA